MRYNGEYYYYITLIAGQMSSLYPKIVKDKNDKFYYLENDILKTQTFIKGAYEVKDSNANLQLKMPNESIKLVVDQGTGRCWIVLKQGNKIDFTHNDTFNDILGFDAVIVDQALTKSPKICDLVISTDIYSHIDVAQGSIFQGNPNDIIYLFSNNIAFGNLINLNIRNKISISEKILFRFDSIFYRSK